VTVGSKPLSQDGSQWLNRRKLRTVVVPVTSNFHGTSNPI
jgi:hypothetical protein